MKTRRREVEQKEVIEDSQLIQKRSTTKVERKKRGETAEIVFIHLFLGQN